MSESDRLKRLDAFRLKDYGLRLSASRISAMAGFHPFAVLPELLMTMVYQGEGQELLQHDATLLGIQIRSEEAILRELASKASKSTANALQSALDVKRGKRVLDTVQVAEQVKQKVLKEAKSSKKLNPDEMKLLQEGVRSSVDTGYGTFHEDEALDLYERQCGWQVRERNASIMAWPFAKAEDLNITVTREQRPTVVPISEATSRRIIETQTTSISTRDTNESKSNGSGEVTTKGNTDASNKSTSAVTNDKQPDLDQVIDGSETDNRATTVPPNVNDETMADALLQVLAKKTETTSLAPHRPERPFFTIYGAVDGIRDELWCPPSAADGEATSAFDQEWQLRQIIVECKHRMKRTFHSPPLYDQIQTTAYCLMYNVNDADIVQVMRKPKPPPPSTKSKVQKTSKTDTATDTRHEIQETSQVKDDIIASETGLSGITAENLTASSTNVIDSKAASDTNESKRSSEKGETDTERVLEAPSEQNKPNGEDEPSGVVCSATTEVACSTPEQVDEVTKDKASNGTTSVEIDIKRVSLDDPLLQHRRNWNDIVLPRLRSFVEAVYRIRCDDSKRYQLLAAMSNPTGNLEGAWNILHEECPWLKDCDTAFRRNY